MYKGVNFFLWACTGFVGFSAKAGVSTAELAWPGHKRPLSEKVTFKNFVWSIIYLATVDRWPIFSLALAFSEEVEKSLDYL